MDPLGLIRFRFSAGGHAWFPVRLIRIIGAGGVSFSSEWTGFSLSKSEYKGMSEEFEIGSLWDIGVSFGIMREPSPSKCSNGEEKTLAFGIGKYMGIQLIFKGGRLEGVTGGFGVGWTSPVTYTIPVRLEDLY
mgnify:CR=1 FL=1